MAQKWAALHEDAAQLAQIADLAREGDTTSLSAFPGQLERASEWQCKLAMDAIDDIDAMMQPGLTALRIIAARGQDAVAPAQALWREFHAARQAVLAVLTDKAAA